jgi:hypothetical protein
MDPCVRSLFFGQRPARHVRRECSVFLAQIVTDSFLGQSEISGQVYLCNKLAQMIPVAD